jgi:hypothetical protein
MTAADRQMLLFTDLPIPPAPPASLPPKPATPWRVAVQALACLLQLPIRAPLRELDRDDLAEPAPVHRIVSAADAPPVQTVAFASVFTMADAAKAAKALQQFGRFGAEQASEPAPYRVERSYADGTLRVIRQRPEETAEWQEREQRRRAKQRPPKPTAKAKTRGKKVRQWDGEESDD